MGWGRLQQGRFGDAVAVLREVVQETDSPGGYAILAATYGHLGQPALAQEVLRRYHAVTFQPAADFARSITNDPSALELFLGGLALAEGRGAADTKSAP